MAILLTTSYQQIATIPLTYGEIRTYAKYSSQSKENNTTTYQLKTTYYIPSQAQVSFGSATAEIDGEKKSYGYTTFYRGESVIQEVGRVITHNEDGSSPTKNVATSWTASFGGSGSTSADVYFPKIDRYPMLTSAPNFNDEDNPTITYTTTMGFSSGILEACIKTDISQDGIVPYRQITVSAGSYTFNLTNEERTLLRQTCTGKTMQIYFVLRTMVNDTKYFSTLERTFSVTNADPTFTTAITETNQDVITILGSSSATNLIKNVSEAQVTVTPTAYKEAIISGVTINNTTITSSPYQTTIVPTSGNFNINVIDSRGYQTAGIETRNLIDYEKVKINNFSFERENPTSSNIILNLDCVYYSLSEHNLNNDVDVFYDSGDGNYISIPSSNYVIDNTNHKLTIINYEISNVLPYTSQAEFTIGVMDMLSLTSDKMTVIKGIPTMDLGEHDLQVNGDLYIADTDRENEFKIYNNFEYSTTEKVVGMWIDGKPIYRIALVYSVNTGNTSHNISSLNIDNVVFENHLCERYTTGGLTDVEGQYYSNSSDYFRAFVRVNTGTIETRLQNGATTNTQQSIIEYTKTTD